MNVPFRIIYALTALLILLIYSILSSVILLFVPRFLRRKKSIKGQRVLITGAGSGVGRELAIEFSKHATTLILVDINRQAMLQTEKLLDRCSPVFVYNCDVSDYKTVCEMAKQVQKDAGDVDILVNNAGIVSGEFLWDLSEEKIVKTMQVNALAHFWTCKAFLPAMMKKNEGHIVSIISIAAMTGGPQVSDYCASKHAALGFAESLEMELRLKQLNGIKVTTVCPSIIDTNLFKGAEFKFGGKLSPSYVAQEVVAGVLENKEMIFLPSRFSILTKITGLLPRWINMRVHEILGNLDVMDNFVGKETTENGTSVTKDKAKKRE